MTSAEYKTKREANHVTRAHEEEERYRDRPPEPLRKGTDDNRGQGSFDPIDDNNGET